MSNFRYPLLLDYQIMLLNVFVPEQTPTKASQILILVLNLCHLTITHFWASASREISFEDRICRVHSLRSCKYKKIIIFFSAFAFMVVSLEDNAVSLHQGKVNETFFILSFFLLYNLPFILFLRY